MQQEDTSTVTPQLFFPPNLHHLSSQHPHAVSTPHYGMPPTITYTQPLTTALCTLMGPFPCTTALGISPAGLYPFLMALGTSPTSLPPFYKALGTPPAGPYPFLMALGTSPTDLPPVKWESWKGSSIWNTHAKCVDSVPPKNSPNKPTRKAWSLCNAQAARNTTSLQTTWDGSVRAKCKGQSSVRVHSVLRGIVVQSVRAMVQ